MRQLSNQKRNSAEREANMENAVYNTMKGMTFGVELEYTGITQRKAVEAIAEAVNGTSRYEGNYLNSYKVAMNDGREWTIETDSSIRGVGCESVSPILTLDDMDMLQNVIRALRKAGAKAHSSCGLHIHIGAKDMTANEVAKLAKMWWMGEEIMIEGCGTQAERVASWCRKLNWGFAGEIAKAGAKITFDKITKLYYKNCGRAEEGYRCGIGSIGQHYSANRYSALNLHNLLQYKAGYGRKPTIEFRLFESTTHAGEIKANVLFALSVVAKAKMTSRIVCNEVKWNKRAAVNDWRMMFTYLGWTGDEFKVARFHFLKRAVAAM